jgi:hypothetical protein
MGPNRRAQEGERAAARAAEEAMRAESERKAIAEATIVGPRNHRRSKPDYSNRLGAARVMENPITPLTQEAPVATWSLLGNLCVTRQVPLYAPSQRQPLLPVPLPPRKFGCGSNVPPTR